MSYRASTINSSESEDDHFSDAASIKMRSSAPKIKPSSKRSTSGKKLIRKKQNTKLNTSYRENVSERLRTEEIDTDILNSITFRQGDGVITIKCPVEDKPEDLYVISHYKMSNIENVLKKDRWKFSEATIRLHINGSHQLNSSLNQTMQAIFDSMLSDPKRQTQKSKTTE